MSIQDLINSAQNNATQATLAAQATQTQQIEEAQIQPAAAEQTVANPLAGLSPEQIAALMAMMGNQNAAPAQQPAAQVVQPQTTMPAASALAQALAPTQQQQVYMPATANQMVEPDMMKFMVGAASLENISAGLAVDAWIKPKFGSMLINDKPVAPFKAILDPTENQGLTASTTVRYYVGDTAQYLKTYDGQLTHDGLPWMDAIRQAMAVSAKPLDRPYASFDMVMTAAEDVMSIDGKEVIVPAGTVIGHATAVTGTANAKKLLDAIRAQGFAHTDTSSGKPLTVGTPVQIKVANESKSKGSNKQWGVLTFELLGAAE